MKKLTITEKLTGKKKPSITELVFILDRSGSMSGLETDTIGGYNSMLQRQKAQPGEVYVTTVLFDDRYELLHNRVPLRSIQPMTSEQYFVRGCTALLDAIGRTIRSVQDTQRRLPRSKRADKVLFVITTDGMENASRSYTYEQVRSMVEQRKEADQWEFLFLGANIDAIATAGRFGIGADRAVNYHADARGTALNYEVLSDAISHMRTSAAPMSASWKSRIEEDYESRRSDRK